MKIITVWALPKWNYTNGRSAANARPCWSPLHTAIGVAIDESNVYFDVDDRMRKV